MNAEQQEHGRPCSRLIRLEEQHAMFKWWQEQQNGTLREIRSALAAMDKKMDDRFAALEEKFDAKFERGKRPTAELQTWVRNALWALVLFAAGLISSHVVFK